MRRTGLVALREFTAYTATISFWVALFVGPLLIGLAALAVGGVERPAPRPVVAVASADPALAAAAAAAIGAAADLNSQPITVVTGAPRPHAATTVTVERSGGQILVEVAGKRLSDTARALLVRDLALSGVAALRVSVNEPPAPPPPHVDPGLAGRFAVVMLLWMNLVGALGMLLQAIVRERANRALEILLTSAQPAEIVLGKLIGVGAVSVVVLAGWMGTGAAIALAAGAAGSADAPRALAAVFGLLRDPASIAAAAAIYLTAFVMYGSALLGLGALAKDLPAAQNLARPVFGVLLIVFFTILAQLRGGALPDWLIWAPPFTPFLLMIRDPASLSAPQTLLAWGIMLASAAAILVFAARNVGVDGAARRWRLRPARA